MVNVPFLTDRFQISGSMISAVDLLKGLGVVAGLSVIDVAGATGYIDTNYEGKAEAATRALADQDFVFVHLEGPVSGMLKPARSLTRSRGGGNGPGAANVTFLTELGYSH